MWGSFDSFFSQVPFIFYWSPFYELVNGDELGSIIMQIMILNEWVSRIWEALSMFHVLVIVGNIITISTWGRLSNKWIFQQNMNGSFSNPMKLACHRRNTMDHWITNLTWLCFFLSFCSDHLHANAFSSSKKNLFKSVKWGLNCLFTGNVLLGLFLCQTWKYQVKVEGPPKRPIISCKDLFPTLGFLFMWPADGQP